MYTTIELPFQSVLVELINFLMLHLKNEKKIELKTAEKNCVSIMCDGTRHVFHNGYAKLHRSLENHAIQV